MTLRKYLTSILCTSKVLALAILGGYVYMMCWRNMYPTPTVELNIINLVPSSQGPLDSIALATIPLKHESGPWDSVAPTQSV